MFKTYEIILDIEKELYTPSNILFSVSLNDFDTVQLLFTITQDGAAFDLTGSTVEFACKKPSGLTVYQEAEITDAAAGKARLNLSVQAYSEWGIYTAELYVRDVDQLAVTSPFYYSSREPVFASAEIESVNDWTALQTILFEKDNKPILIDGVPTTIPEYIGQRALDTTGRRLFIAYDLTAAGWELVAAGTGGGGVVYWADILGKPATFAPAAHTHDEYLTPAEADLLYQPIGTGGAPTAHTHAMTDITGLIAALDGKADNADLTGYAPADHVHTFDSITNKPAAYTPAAHTHPTADITGLDTALAGKAAATHTHATADITGLDTALAGKADAAHTHTAANITDFAAGVAANIPAEYLTVTEGDAAYQPKGTYLTAVPPEYLTQTEGDARYAIKGTESGTVAAAWGDIAGTLSNQLDLQAALDAKADDAHTHTAANITDFAAGVAANIPAEYLTTTEGDAAYQAKGVVPAHTHTAANITDFGTAVAANIPAEYLTELEGDARYMAAGAAPAAHTHAIADVTGLSAALDGKADDGHTHTAANITDFGTAVAANIPAEYLTTTEGDAAYQPKGTYLTAVPPEYLTETEGDARYMAAGAAPTAHTHTAAQITDFAAGVAANIPAEYLTATEGDAAYQPINTVATHTHTAANITDFGTAVAANIPAEYLTTTEADAAYQAINTVAAHTHTAANITDFGTAVAANIPAEYLTTTEGDAAYQAKGNYLTSVPLMSGAQRGGAMVGNGLAMSTEYLFVKTGAGLGIAADNSLQVMTSDATPAPLKFWTGTAADYAAATKDANTLYFVTG